MIGTHLEPLIVVAKRYRGHGQQVTPTQLGSYEEEVCTLRKDYLQPHHQVIMGAKHGVGSAPSRFGAFYLPRMGS